MPLPSPSATRAHTQERRPHECRHRQSSPESHTHARPPVCRCTREPGPAAHFLRPPAPPATRAHPPRGVGTVRLTHQRVSQAPAVPVTLPCSHAHPVGLVPVSHVHTHVHTGLWQGLAHGHTQKRSVVPARGVHARVARSPALPVGHVHVCTPTRTRHGWFQAHAHTHAVVTRPVSSCHMHTRTPWCPAPPVMRAHTHTCAVGPGSTCPLHKHVHVALSPAPLRQGGQEGGGWCWPRAEAPHQPFGPWGAGQPGAIPQCPGPWGVTVVCLHPEGTLILQDLLTLKMAQPCVSWHSRCHGGMSWA